MSTEFDPGQGTAPEPAIPDPGDVDRDADVLFLTPARDAAPAPDGGNAGRDGRPPALPPVPGDQPDGDDDDDDDDAVDRESVLVGRILPGRPVDPQDEPRPFAPRGSGVRPPVVPPWLASRAALAASLAWAAKEARYHAGFHAVRAPKYAVKTAVYAVPGAARAVARLVRWASAEEGNWHLRQAAADRGDAAVWLALDARRQRQARWRWPVLIGGTIVLAAGAALLAVLPGLALWRLAALAVAVAVAARAGRPADKPITDRVSQGKAYRKLTAELVRRALLSVQLSGINSAVAKDPNAITFPAGDPPGRPRAPGRGGPALRGGGRRRDRPPRAAGLGAAAAAGSGLARARPRAHRPPGAVGRARARLPDAAARLAAAAVRHGRRVQAVRVRHHPADGAHRRVAGVPELAVRRPARIGQVLGHAAAGPGRRARRARRAARVRAERRRGLREGRARVRRVRQRQRR